MYVCILQGMEITIFRYLVGLSPASLVGACDSGCRRLPPPHVRPKLTKAPPSSNNKISIRRLNPMTGGGREMTKLISPSTANRKTQGKASAHGSRKLLDESDRAHVSAS